MSTNNLYTADGVQTSYAFSFPYIVSIHVKVFVNSQLMLTPMHYSITGSTVNFVNPPEQDAVIEIKRQTSPSDTLVDFVDGSTLREADLDTAYLHNFYLSQEYADGFSKLINDTLIRIADGTGVTETEPDEIVTALVNRLLEDEAAADLQQRVNDIDTNAEAIVSLGANLQIQLNGLAQGVAAVVYLQSTEPVPGVGGIPDPITDGARWYDTDDNNTQYIYDQESSEWLDISDPRVGQIATELSVLTTEVDDNAAAIVTESLARSTADSALASTLALLGAQNGAQTAFIVDSATVKIDSDSGDTLATRFSALSAADSTNSAAITSEETARTTADSAIASDVTTLAARVTTTEGDITTNAADIVTEQAARVSADASNASDITALSAAVDLKARTFAQTGTPTSPNSGDLWIDTGNGNQLKRWSGSGWETVENAAIAGNASAITGLTTRVTTAEGDITSTASDVTALQASVTTLDGEVSTAQVTADSAVTASSSNATGITTLEAKQGVRLDVNGYVTGYTQNNDGEEGNFIIRADRFAVIDPGATSGIGTVPFEVVGGTVKMQDVEINGNLILNGSVVGAALANGTIGATQIGANAITTDKLSANSITAAKIQANAITADKINATTVAALELSTGSLTVDGDLTMSNTSSLQGGQTAFDTGTGFFLGYEGGQYKFSLGNSAGDTIKWDGSQLTIVGDVEVGEYTPNDDILLSADTPVSVTSGAVWTKKKEFSTDKDGTLRVSAKARRNSGVVDETTPQWRIKTDGTVRKTFTVLTTSYVEESWDVPVTKGGNVEIELNLFNATGSLLLLDARVKGRVIIAATGGSVVLD